MTESDRPFWTSTAATVKLIQYMGDDIGIARAAWVSTKGQRAADEANGEKIQGLLKFLMKNRHGTPYEHNGMTFLIRVPLFTMREHQRHRIGISYNEFSGRYSVMVPEFYEPSYSRTQTGKPGEYTMTQGTAEQDNAMRVAIRSSNKASWREYQNMLNAGVSKEIARMVLPLNIMTSAYVTFNARSLMNFLQLRMASNAQQEIQDLAWEYNRIFNDLFPITAELFHLHGNQAP